MKKFNQIMNTITPDANRSCVLSTFRFTAWFILLIAFVVAVLRNSMYEEYAVRAEEEVEILEKECNAYSELDAVRQAVIEDYKNQLIELTGDAEYRDSTLYAREIVAIHNLQKALWGCSEFEINGEYAE